MIKDDTVLGSCNFHITLQKAHELMRRDKKFTNFNTENLSGSSFQRENISAYNQCLPNALHKTYC